jgi:uncharacterized integral membrane protein
MSSPEQPPVRMERQPAKQSYGGLIAPAVIAVLVLILILQNRGEPWRFHFFFWWLSLRAWLMLAVLLALGFLIGMAVSALLRRRRMREHRRRAMTE